MARLKCTCGNGMSNSNDPSENIVAIYPKEDVGKALGKEPEMRLIDFDTLDWEYEYWYCPECKRIHKVENIPCGKVVARFIPCEKDITVEKIDETWKEFYLFSDAEMYDVEEEDGKLRDFIENIGDSHLYWVDAEHKNIYKKDASSVIKLVYVKEE